MASERAVWVVEWDMFDDGNYERLAVCDTEDEAKTVSAYGKRGAERKRVVKYVPATATAKRRRK